MASRIGIIAGGDRLPARLAHAARAAGRDPFVIALEGFADTAWLGDFPHKIIRIGAIGEMFEALKEQDCVELCLAGRVRRPGLLELRPDWRATKFLAKVGMKALGDDNLLKIIVREIESEGFKVIGADDIATDLLMPEGLLSRVAPDEQATIDLTRGVAVCRRLGAADVGQACVVQQGLVLAVEAIEGTDIMLGRVASLRREGPGGVLVKMMKPRQERRVDLPAIGPDTVRAAAAAGLRGVAAEAGGALLLDRAATIAAADEAGLFLIGLKPPEPKAAESA